MTPRSVLAVVSAAGLTGCAVFSGYRHEPARRTMPASLRGGAAPAGASVHLSPDGSSANGGATTSREVSLAEVVSVAREDSNRVLEAMARLDVASGRVQEADGALLPGAGIEAGGSYLRGRDINNAGDELDGLDYGRFEPSASIYYRANLGAAITKSQRGRREADAAAYDAQEARRIAGLQAGLGYLDLVLAHASLMVAEDLIADAKRFLGITQALAQAEIGSGADVAQAEAETARARQTALRARGRWERASVRLAVLLRWDPEELLVPANWELQPTPLVNGAHWQDLRVEAEQARPDLRATHARAEAASHLATARWWELLGPELNAGVRERLIGLRLRDLTNTTLAHVFLGFSLDFGEIGRLRAAKGEARAAELRQQAKLEQVHGELSAALVDVRTAKESIPQAQAGVEAAERSYRIQLDRFQAGTGLGLEVIEAQNAQARARRDLAEAIVRYNLAQVELAATVGHLEPEMFDSSSRGTTVNTDE